MRLSEREPFRPEAADTEIKRRVKENKMKQTVIIKSSKYGMTLFLDDRIPFEDLIRDICRKFHDSKSFFGASSFALGIEGRKMTAKEIQVVVEAIELNSEIHISMLQETDPMTDKLLVKSMEEARLLNIYRNAMIINGSVRREKKISSDTSVIVLGDLSARASIQTAGNVIVMGTLSGQVTAGYPDNDDCYIVANQFDNHDLTIGSVSGSPVEEKKWSFRARKSKNLPRAVAVFEGALIMEPLSSGLVPQLTGRKLKEE